MDRSTCMILTDIPVWIIVFPGSRPNISRSCDQTVGSQTLPIMKNLLNPWRPTCDLSFLRFERQQSPTHSDNSRRRVRTIHLVVGRMTTRVSGWKGIDWNPLKVTHPSSRQALQASCVLIVFSMDFSGSPKRWDRFYSPSPNWQEKYHLYNYIPLIVLAFVWGLYATYHPLREPETTIELGCPAGSDRFTIVSKLFFFLT